MRLDLHCTCGGAWRGDVGVRGGAYIYAEWQKVHSGPGHAPCNAATARRARGKAEKKQR